MASSSNAHVRSVSFIAEYAMPRTLLPVPEELLSSPRIVKLGVCKSHMQILPSCPPDTSSLWGTSTTTRQVTFWVCRGSTSRMEAVSRSQQKMAPFGPEENSTCATAL